MISQDDSSAPVWPLRLAALGLALLGIMPMANLVAPGGGLAWWGPSMRLWIVWTVLTVCLAFAIAKLVPRACDALERTASSALLRPSTITFGIAVAATTALLALVLSWHTFQLKPITIDELSSQWQAMLLTHGRLYAAAERHPEFFGTMQTLQSDGRSVTHFPIGAPAILSLGMLIGAPWLVNPVLAALAACAVYSFARRIGSEGQARGVALLFALSPFVLFLAATQLDHIGELLFVWLAIAALPRWASSPDSATAARSAAFTGMMLGIAVSIRPYDAALMTLAIGAFQLHAAWRRPILGRSLVVQMLAGAVPVAVLLACNAVTTGHPLPFAYDVLNGSAHRPGFHVDPFGLPHTPRRGLFNISAYLMRLDVSLLAWPAPALALVVVVLAWQRRATRWDLLLLGALGAILVGYWAYWGEGRSPGPRFLLTVAPVFLIYVARLPGALRERARGEVARRAIGLLIPIWLLTAWLSPPRNAQPFGVWTLAKRTAERDTATPLVLEAVGRGRISHALVFIDDGWHARLASRLRVLGARPFMAQRIVGHYDACMLQQLLDSAEHTGAPAQRQAELVFTALDRDPGAPPISGLPALEQLALDPARSVTDDCARSLRDARSNGADLARFLPLATVDSAGRVDGDVIYVRDHGERNALLRERFADRDWYRVRVDTARGRLLATISRIRTP